MLIHALEKLKFLLVSRNNFVEFLIIIHLFCSFIIIVLVLILLEQIEQNVVAFSVTCFLVKHSGLDDDIVEFFL